MRATIDTKELKALLQRASKGVGNNPSALRTCWLGLKGQDGVLSISSWDGENYQTVSTKTTSADNFSVTVVANTFCQLVDKTTTSKITLELKDNYLEVKGNGTYKLELPVNEEGLLDVYPQIKVPDVEAIPCTKSIFDFIVKSNKVSLAKTPEQPHLMSYYLADKVYTTDNRTATISGVTAFDKPCLLSPQLLELVVNADNDNVNCYVDGNKIYFATENTLIQGYLGAEVTQFAEFVAPALDQLVGQEMKSTCSILKSELLGVLDRMLLFVKAKEEAIKVSFTSNGIHFYNNDRSINEIVPFVKSEGFEPFEYSFQLDVLKDLVSTNKGDEIDFYYGVAGFIKIGDGNVQQLLTAKAE